MTVDTLKRFNIRENLNSNLHSTITNHDKINTAKHGHREYMCMHTHLEIHAQK